MHTVGSCPHCGAPITSPSISVSTELEINYHCDCRFNVKALEQGSDIINWDFLKGGRVSPYIEYEDVAPNPKPFFDHIYRPWLITYGSTTGNNAQSSFTTMIN